MTEFVKFTTNDGTKMMIRADRFICFHGTENQGSYLRGEIHLMDGKNHVTRTGSMDAGQNARLFVIENQAVRFVCCIDNIYDIIYEPRPPNIKIRVQYKVTGELVLDYNFEFDQFDSAAPEYERIIAKISTM